MKLVKWMNGDGWLQQSFIKNNMPNSKADLGIPHNPPDLRQIDCEGALQELNELLIQRELITLDDLNKNPNMLQNSILSVFHRRILDLYKQEKIIPEFQDEELKITI